MYTASQHPSIEIKSKPESTLVYLAKMTAFTLLLTGIASLFLAAVLGV